MTKPEVSVKEGSIDVAVQVNASITEFGKALTKDYFEARYKGKAKVIFVAYMNHEAAGYMIGYEKEDGSCYCWMAGVDPKYRRNGLMTLMMDHLESWAKNKNYTKSPSKHVTNTDLCAISF